MPRTVLWIGRILIALPVFVFGFSAIAKVLKPSRASLGSAIPSTGQSEVMRLLAVCVCALLRNSIEHEIFMLCVTA